MEQPVEGESSNICYAGGNEHYILYNENRGIYALQEEWCGVVYDLSVERKDETEEVEGCESSQQVP